MLTSLKIVTAQGDTDVYVQSDDTLLEVIARTREVLGNQPDSFTPRIFQVCHSVADC